MDQCTLNICIGLLKSTVQTCWESRNYNKRGLPRCTDESRNFRPGVYLLTVWL